MRLGEVLPTRIADWPMTVEGMFGKVYVTARRSGITVQLIRDVELVWHVTKWKGGKELGYATARRLPIDLTRKIEAQLGRKLVRT